MDTEDGPVYQAIVRELARNATQRVVDQAIAALKSLSSTLSGADSRLSTVWEEICVQVQDEESLYWSAYEQTVEDTILGLVRQLSAAEQAAIWIGSEASIDWLLETEDSRPRWMTIDDIRVDQEQVVSEIASDLYRAAADDSSPAVEAYLAGVDDDDDDEEDFDDPDDSYDDDTTSDESN